MSSKRITLIGHTLKELLTLMYELGFLYQLPTYVVCRTRVSLTVCCYRARMEKVVTIYAPVKMADRVTTSQASVAVHRGSRDITVRMDVRLGTMALSVTGHAQNLAPTVTVTECLATVIVYQGTLVQRVASPVQSSRLGSTVSINVTVTKGRRLIAIRW